MPSITTIHESLPYIDPAPTSPQLRAAEALIALERSAVPDDPNHALLPPPPPPLHHHHPSDSSSYLTPLLQAELARLSADKSSKLAALDLARYSSLPEVPEEVPSDSTALRSALAQAYTSQSYVSSRRTHLALLDAHGKNAWLMGNYHLESELRSLESELAAAKREIDLLTLQRKSAQDQAGPELLELERTWKAGVGRVLETEAAAEALRRQVLELMRRREEEAAAQE